MEVDTDVTPTVEQRLEAIEANLAIMAAQLGKMADFVSQLESAVKSHPLASRMFGV